MIDKRRLAICLNIRKAIKKPEGASAILYNLTVMKSPRANYSVFPKLYNVSGLAEEQIEGLTSVLTNWLLDMMDYKGEVLEYEDVLQILQEKPHR